MRAVARAQDARLGRWLGRVGWHGPGVLSFVPPIRHRRDSDAIAATRTPSPRLGTPSPRRSCAQAAAASRSSNCSTAARSPRALAALAVEEEPQLKPAEHAVAHYGAAGALFADPRF